MSFSQRHGYKPVDKKFQMEEIDEDLRNSLWNMLNVFYFQNIKTEFKKVDEHDYLGDIAVGIWGNHFKKPIDEIQKQYCVEFIKTLREKFYDSKWYEVYDIIEFFAKKFEPEHFTIKEFTDACNAVLEQEFSGYRFVGNKLSKIISKEEIKEIEIAINSEIDSINNHLATSLSMLSDKKQQDFRNSIKESISAVEAICKIIADDSNATMTQALTSIEKTGKIQLHPKMKDALQKLYGYTNDASGIRHSIMDGKSIPDFEDAKFMLVSCSAITNYLISRCNKVGIQLT